MATQIKLRPGAKKDGSKSPTSATRKALAKQGEAMSDGSFPTPNVDFLHRAVRSIGRAPASKRPALKAYLRKRAKALGQTQLLQRPSLQLSNDDIDMLEFAGAIVTPPGLVPGARNKLTSKGGQPAVKAPKGDTPGKKDADGDFDGDTPADVLAKKKLGLQNKQALDTYRKCIKRGLAPAVALQAAKMVDKKLGNPHTRAKEELANSPKA
jgi:hypothetical protein